MNIQPQPQSTQLQQHQLLSSDTNINNNKPDTLTISNSSTSVDSNSSLSFSSATAATFKNIPNPQQGNNFYASSSPSPAAANNNGATVTNASGNQTYFIQPQNNFSSQAQTGSPMAVKQPLQQQQQYQQFANQNSNDMQQQHQQQYQNNINNNLKYYMTNSPVTTGNHQIIQNSASPRVLNFNNANISHVNTTSTGNSNNNNGSQAQQYVLQDIQQNQLNSLNGSPVPQQNNNNNGNAINVIMNQSGSQQQQQQQVAGGTIQNSNGQIFLNINNRIVPVQALNLKQANNANNNTMNMNSTNVNNINCNVNNTNVNSPNNTTNMNSGHVVQQQQTGQRIQIINAVSANNTNVQSPKQMVQIRPYLSDSSSAMNSPEGSNSGTNVANSGLAAAQQTTSNLSAEITEKMRLLENIQKQLRTYQVKIASVTQTDTDPTKSNSSAPTAYTTQQIQQALSAQEQAILQRLIIQRKTVQTEIQTLQQKLLTPNSPAPTTLTSTGNTTNGPMTNMTHQSHNLTNASTTTTTPSSTTMVNHLNTGPNQQQQGQPNPLTKLQLYQQILIKLNTFKNSKTVTIPGESGNQQQLQLTTEEFEQLKKLLELQNQLQNELNLTQAQIQTIQTNLMNANLISKPIANQTIQIVNSAASSSVQTIGANEAQKATETQPTLAAAATAATTATSVQMNPGKISDWSLAEKHKVLEMIKSELNKLKINLNQLNLKQQQCSASGGPALQEILNQQQQIKDRYLLLVKKQSELQTLMAQQEKQAATSNSVTDSITATINQVSQQFSQNQNPQSPQVQLSFSNQQQGTSSLQQQQQQQQQHNSIPAPQTIHIVNNSANSPKSTPIKIRNLNTHNQQQQQQQQSPGTQLLATLNKGQAQVIQRPQYQQQPQYQQPTYQQSQPGTPLRALVTINNTNGSSPSLTPIAVASPATATATVVQQQSPSLVPLAQCVQLQKQYFSHVKFKCLNFEELAQHGVITKQTENTTIDLIKELDNRASLLTNPDQIASFGKNQVKLVKKFLEQQQLLKSTIRSRFQNQLLKEQNLITEPSQFITTPFTDQTDILKRLAPFHMFQRTEFEPSEEDHRKFDECFEQVSEKLLRKADAMKKRFHLFQLRSMQKEVESTEATLILKLFVDDLKQGFDEEKLKASQVKEAELEVGKVKQEGACVVDKESPTNFKHLILSSKAVFDDACGSGLSSAGANATNVNNDFTLLDQPLNPLKRHLKMEEIDEDDPDSFVDETSSHRTIKMPSFTRTVSDGSKNGVSANRDGRDNPSLGHAGSSSAATVSFNASSSSSGGSSNSGISNEVVDNNNKNTVEEAKKAKETVNLSTEAKSNEIPPCTQAIGTETKTTRVEPEQELVDGSKAVNECPVGKQHEQQMSTNQMSGLDELALNEEAMQSIMTSEY